jgi:tRNA nucleotidyltransferase (CCA-adding enzyme)
MKTYKVGGAVRDHILGRAVHDVDWVVVGATVEQMLALGYTQVGADFPVFLHPESRQEYALARTERKTAPGYRGFVVHASQDVTLEEDLFRRDLTINAMAMTEEGKLVDPFGGAKDLAKKVMRHVSPAFREDPVRILRVARFAARFGDFSVADETMAVMREMVEEDEVDALVPERVWQEIAKGLMEPHPWRMLDVLRECGALKRVLPEVEAMVGVPQVLLWHPEDCTYIHTKMVLAEAAKAGASMEVRFACLVHDLGKAKTPRAVLPRHLGHEAASVALIEALCARLRVPNEAGALATVVAREHTNVHASTQLNAKAVLRLLERCDAIRRPERFREVLKACAYDARGRLGMQDRPYPQHERLRLALDAALRADVSGVAKRLVAEGKTGQAVGAAVRACRAGAIEAVLAEENAMQASEAGV